MSTIQIDRAVLEASLAKIKAERDEQEIAALADAQLTEHARAEAELAEAKAHAKNCADLAKAEQALLADTAEAQSLIREYAAVTARRLEHIALIARLYYVVSRGQRAPSDLTVPDAEKRFGYELSSVMAAIPGCKSRLGDIEWLANPHYNATTNWIDAMRSVLERHIDPILGKEKTE
jgi:hypothetical protein